MNIGILSKLGRPHAVGTAVFLSTSGAYDTMGWMLDYGHAVGK